MLKRIPLYCALLVMLSCSHQPTTDAELASTAQRAVDDRLDSQGQFSLMESVVAQGIACGHVTATHAPGHGHVEQDFVYQKGRLIMDDDPDFDSAAIACDLAASGGNSADPDDVANGG